MAALNVWMNGDLVGEWTTLRTGTHVFRYNAAWAQADRARPLSLSLPLTADLEVRGEVVENYFDNLLPDSTDIRRRIRDRFRTRSADAFELLTAIGRDCVGAVQLLAPDQEPIGWNRVEGVRLSDSDVERLLHNVTAPVSSDNFASDAEDLRISIAGAQEKTALLSMGGKWFRPLGATPTTHILKLPLGVIGGFRGDFSNSVENEWFCGQFLREIGLPVADSRVARFGDQTVLVVTRFDRRWTGVGSESTNVANFKPAADAWIARLPQEDFCQATGCPPNQKYEADGGPSIDLSLQLLAGSERSVEDKTLFVLTQLAFWILAATDGHGKNFSLQHLAGSAYRMTPLYDVLSSWPVIGTGKNQLAPQKAKLAMALRGKSSHYRLTEIGARHWRELAVRTGIPGVWERMLALIESAAPALDRIQTTLPADFPENVAARIDEGVRRQARSFVEELKVIGG